MLVNGRLQNYRECGKLSTGRPQLLGRLWLSLVLLWDAPSEGGS